MDQTVAVKTEVDGLKFGSRIGRIWVGLRDRGRERQVSRMVLGFLF